MSINTLPIAVLDQMLDAGTLTQEAYDGIVKSAAQAKQAKEAEKEARQARVDEYVLASGSLLALVREHEEEVDSKTAQAGKNRNRVRHVSFSWEEGGEKYTFSGSLTHKRPLEEAKSA